MCKSNYVRGAAAFLLGLCTFAATAGTLDEISQKNRESLMLSAEIDIARKKNELKKALTGESVSAPTSSEYGAVGMPPAGSAAPQAAPLQAPPAVARLNVPSAQKDPGLLSLRAVYGDEANPFVEFAYDNEEQPAIRQGEMVLPYWRLRAAHGRAAVIERIGKNGKIVDTRTFRLPVTSASAPVSKYEELRTSPRVSLPMLPELNVKR